MMRKLSYFSIVGTAVVMASSMAVAPASAEGPVRKLIQKVQEKRQAAQASSVNLTQGEYPIDAQEYFRLYAPTKAYFDRSWRMYDIEKSNKEDGS